MQKIDFAGNPLFNDVDFAIDTTFQLHAITEHDVVPHVPGLYGGSALGVDGVLASIYKDNIT